MTSILTYTRWPSAATLQYFFWRHPEWWSGALCCFAWAVMLRHGWRHAGHEIHWRTTFEQELAYFMLMVAAMMLPLVIHRVWVTAINSLWTRRHRAIAGFLGGYFAPWLGFGIAAAGLRESSWTHTYAAAALCFITAAVWQTTSMHQRGLAACHRTQPLAPTGWRADRDCLRFGWTIGAASIVSCWPLMLACTFAGHSPIAMLGGMVVGASERWWFRLSKRAILLITLAIAGFYVVLTVFKGGSAIAFIKESAR